MENCGARLNGGSKWNVRLDGIRERKAELGYQT